MEALVETLETVTDESSFAKPASPEELHLEEDLDSFLLELRERHGDNLGSLIRSYFPGDEEYVTRIFEKPYSEALIELFYVTREHSCSNKAIKQDKCQRIRDYKNYLNQQGLTKAQRYFLRKSYFVGNNTDFQKLRKGRIPNEVAAWLWCMYPSEEESLDTAYEQNLKEMIKNVVSEKVS